MKKNNAYVKEFSRRREAKRNDNRWTVSMRSCSQLNKPISRKRPLTDIMDVEEEVLSNSNRMTVSGGDSAEQQPVNNDDWGDEGLYFREEEDDICSENDVITSQLIAQCPFDSSFDVLDHINALEFQFRLEDIDFQRRSAFSDEDNILISYFSEFMKKLPTDTLKKDFLNTMSKSGLVGNKDILSFLSRKVTDYEPFLSFDVCRKCDDYVYAGDTNHDDKCGNCGQHRYYPCSRCRKVGKCSHNDRRPHKVLHYRPVLTILRNLFKCRSFCDALEYKHLDSQSGYVTDIMDSKLAKTHLREMHQFHQHRQDARRGIFLLLQLSFDGAQVFTTRTSKFNPLILGILNLPPSFRKIVGVGMFVLSISTSSEGTIEY
jgi:predicted RNA-binding Zn-ribbon protein involved in translation (DUF1610 family)